MALIYDWLIIFVFFFAIFNNKIQILIKYFLIPINRVRAYGPGIEPIGPVVGAPANFTVETFSAGKGKAKKFNLNLNF